MTFDTLMMLIIDGDGLREAFDPRQRRR